MSTYGEKPPLISCLIEIVITKCHPTNKTTSYNPLIIDLWIRLLSFHSPLLRKSVFVSIPLLINMFKFSRYSYWRLSITGKGKNYMIFSNPSEESLRSIVQRIPRGKPKRQLLLCVKCSIVASCQLFDSPSIKITLD